MCVYITRGFCLICIYVVVRLPRPFEGKGVTSIFRSYQKLPVPPQATGVIGTLNCCAFSYIIPVF